MKTYDLPEPVLLKKDLSESSRNPVKKHRFIPLFFFFFWVSHANGLPATKYALYLICQADGELAPYAQKALHALQTALTQAQEGTFSVCVDMIKSESIERYALSAHGCTLDGIYPRGELLNVITQGCKIAFSKPAQRRILIFSGHGTGILEPSWNESTARWECEPDRGNSPYVQYGLGQTATLLGHLDRVWEGKSLFSQKGRMAGLSTKELTEIMRFTCTEVLGGNKIDIVGFDACHMAMLEIAYEMKEYAHFVIASQECEEKEGWNYDTLLTLLTAEQELFQVPRALVYGYDAQQRKSGQDRYSLSAFDLSYVDDLAAAVGRIVVCMEDIMRTSSAPELLGALCRARHHNQRFSGMLMYADLFTFLDTLLYEIEPMIVTNEVDCLKTTLIAGIESLHHVVIAHGAGKACPLARGCSVYFPVAHIDTSYTNAFASDHRWYSFLQFFTTPASVMSLQL